MCDTLQGPYWGSKEQKSPLHKLAPRSPNPTDPKIRGWYNPHIFWHISLCFSSYDYFLSFNYIVHIGFYTIALENCPEITSKLIKYSASLYNKYKHWGVFKVHAVNILKKPHCFYFLWNLPLYLISFEVLFGQFSSAIV